MNRRVFLQSLGAVATQQKLGTLNPQAGLDGEDPPVRLARFPYIQNVRHDRASILWSTFEPGFGQVKYTTDGVNYEFVAATSRPFGRAETGLLYDYYQYQADLTGLSAGTNYLYSVSVNGRETGTAGETRFRTPGPGPFKFIVLGDSGSGTSAQFRIAQHIFAEKPALVIHTGDLIYPVTTFEFYQRHYFDYYASTMGSVPFFPCPGNHDYQGQPDAAPYLAVHAFPSEGIPSPDIGRYYSFDWGNVHFVSLDAHLALERAVNANGPMLRWLDYDLRTTRQYWRVVFFHYPPYATGQNTNDVHSQWVRQYVVPIMERHGVQLVFSGHEHSYQRSVPIRRSSRVGSNVGTTYFTTGGGGCEILYPASTTTLVEASKSEYHYVRVEVQGTRIVIRSIRHDGTELDNYPITPSPVFSDDPRVTPVTITPGPVAGGKIRIVGRGLAVEENFLCGPAPQTEIGGTVVTVNGVPIQLLYVSPTQIYGQLPFDFEGNITIRVTTPNGAIERSI